MCRRRFYVAPEIARGDPYDEQCDVYSFGVLLIEMGHRGGLKQAFGATCTGLALASRIVEGWRPDLPPELAAGAPWSEVGVLVEKCMVDDPWARPTMKAAVAELALIGRKLRAKRNRGWTLDENAPGSASAVAAAAAAAAAAGQAFPGGPQEQHQGTKANGVVTPVSPSQVVPSSS